MKKKLALLLALSMVLSMVPVVTFGASNAIFDLTKSPRILAPSNAGETGSTVQFDIGLKNINNGQLNREFQFLFEISANGTKYIDQPASGNMTVNGASLTGKLKIEFYPSENYTDTPILLWDTTKPSTYTVSGASLAVVNFADFGSNLRPNQPNVATLTLRDDASGFVLSDTALNAGGFLRVTLPYYVRGKVTDKVETTTDVAGDIKYTVQTSVPTTITSLGTTDTIGTELKKATVTIARKLGDKPVVLSFPKDADAVVFDTNATIGDITITEGFAGSFRDENPAPPNATGTTTPTPTKTDYRTDRTTIVLNIMTPYVRWDMSGSPITPDIDAYRESTYRGLIKTDGIAYVARSAEASTSLGDNNSPNRKYTAGITDQRLTLNVDAGKSLSSIIGSITLSGLRIYAEDRAKLGDVLIEVTCVNSAYEDADEDGKYYEWIAATRTNRTVELSYTDAKKYGTAEDFEIYSGDYHQETAAFTITELTNNAIQFIRNNGLRISVPDGMKIVSAEVYLRDVEEDPFDGGTSYKVGAYPLDYLGVVSNSNPDPRTGVMFNGDPSLPNELSGEVLVNNYDYIDFMPYITRNDYDSGRIAIDVLMTVNVAPGYVGGVGKDEVVVTIGGHALNGAKFVAPDKSTDPEIAIAVIEDRIEVAVSETPPFNMLGTGQYTLHQEIGVITITELEAGVLKYGETLTVFIEDPIAQIALDSLKPVTDAKSGLEIGNFRRGSGTISFEIFREADGDEPGVITINGANISGWLNPQTKYNVVVAGTAVAENFTQTYSRTYPEFLNDNYYTDYAFSFTGNNPGVVTPIDPDSPTPGMPVKVESISFGSETIMTTDGPLSNPFRTNLPGTVGDTGYLALRAFEKLNFKVEWLGGIQSSVTDPFTGKTLTYYIGSEVGYLDGAPVTFVNNDGVPAKVLQATVDGEIRTFLPARTVASLFGYEVSCPAPYTSVYLNLIK